MQSLPIPVQLPLWVEYVKALGTPVVALIAACIAGSIAYRQWATARNKLKLDFFEKRVAIYKLALLVLENARTTYKIDVQAVGDLENSLYSSRWLFDEKVELYLRSLPDRAFLLNKKASKIDDNITEEEFALALVAHEEREAAYQKERSDLNCIVSPFLTLGH